MHAAASGKPGAPHDGWAYLVHRTGGLEGIEEVGEVTQQHNNKRIYCEASRVESSGITASMASGRHAEAQAK